MRQHSGQFLLMRSDRFPVHYQSSSTLLPLPLLLLPQLLPTYDMTISFLVLTAAASAADAALAYVKPDTRHSSKAHNSHCLPPYVQAPGKLCATPYGVDIVGITEFILLVGAFVGGAVARQRKQEMEKLNDQLRTINISLRQQARSGTVYAPGTH